MVPSVLAMTMLALLAKSTEIVEKEYRKGILQPFAHPNKLRLGLVL